MTTRKKVTDQAKPPAKRSRKKANPEPAGGLFSDNAQAEATQSDSGVLLEDSDNEGALTQDPVSIRSEPLVSSTEKPELHLKPSEPTTPKQEQVDAVAQSWLLVTNHQNLIYMLAAGLVMGPAGFFGKHYRDPSSELSGLLPVFRGGVPDAAIQQSVSENKHLRPCAVELDLAGLIGPVCLVSRDGVVSSGTLPLRIGSNSGALLIRAPLPMALVKRLVFRTSTDRKEFEAAARSFANVDLSGLRIDVSEECFNTAQSVPWPLPDQPRDSVQDWVDQPPARGEAIGGGLAMLYQLANRSDLCCSVYRMATGAGDVEDAALVQRDPVLAELVPWIESGGRRPDSPLQAQLFWGAVQALVDARLSVSAERPVDIVLGYLDDQLNGLQESGHQTRLERLVSDMRGTFGLGGGTISQLFERHKGTLSRPLLLFCLRERCVDLLEFSHPDLSDEEFVLAAILFGVRDGWFGLPVELRTAIGLSRFVEHRMFEAECKQRSAKLSLDHAPQRPIPLRELLMRGDGTWSVAQTASLAKVFDRLGWQDCIVSRIRLSQGQYRLNISAEGVEVVVRGGIRLPTVEVDKGALLKKISQWPPLPREIESEMRSALHYKA